MQKKRVGVLGSGIVGQVLGGGFISRGHEVMLGSREKNNEKTAQWQQKHGATALTGDFAETAAFGDIVVLATLGTATLEVLRLAGHANFAGKVVIDATNPLDFSKGAPPTLFVGCNDSLGEQVQRAIPDARVVKAFNTSGNAHMIDPKFPDGPPDMFLCGNDDEAKAEVAELCRAFGWGIADIGTIEGSRYLEAMCIAWVLYGLTNKTWDHAFRMLRK